MSRGRICPGSLAEKARSPGPPAAAYSVMKNVPPATARPSAPRKPPCWPPAEVDVCIWIAIDIQESSPDSAKTLSPGCMLCSSTGITVPTILDSIWPSLQLFTGRAKLSGLVRMVPVVDRSAPCLMRRGVARALVADSDHEHLGVHWLEPVALGEVLFQRADQLFLDVQNATAHLAHGVVMIAARQLVVSRTLAQVGRVDAARGGECLECPINGAARETGLGSVELGRNLV